MSPEKKCISKFDHKQKVCKKTCLLDLPDVALDCILERLSPQELCKVAQVCSHLRNISKSDNLWEKHIQQKWSRLVGEAAHHEWQWHRKKILSSQSIRTLSAAWPLLGFRSYLENYGAFINLIKNSSKMALFICLQTGRFWFPAQLYESVLVMFECYDTLVSYDSKTDTFINRSPINQQDILDGLIQWDELRIPPPDTFLTGYYNSNSLTHLKPGDHVEIQTRRQIKDPYAWRFAVVAHLESCDKDMNHCRCQHSDTLVLEFKQLFRYSQPKRLALNRNVDKECWDGLFGGIRKLDTEEIGKWNNLFLSRGF